MNPPIPWDHEPGPPDHLEVDQIVPTVSVGMRVDEEGDYIISFVVGIKGSTRSLPEIEDFIRRCAALLDDEPVLPEEPMS